VDQDLAINLKGLQKQEDAIIVGGTAVLFCAVCVALVTGPLAAASGRAERCVDFSPIFRFEVIMEDIDHDLAVYRWVPHLKRSDYGGIRTWTVGVAVGGAVEAVVVAGAWRALRKTSRRVGGSMTPRIACRAALAPMGGTAAATGGAVPRSPLDSAAPLVVGSWPLGTVVVTGISVAACPAGADGPPRMVE